MVAARLMNNLMAAYNIPGKEQALFALVDFSGHAFTFSGKNAPYSIGYSMSGLIGYQIVGSNVIHLFGGIGANAENLTTSTHTLQNEEVSLHAAHFNLQTGIEITGEKTFATISGFAGIGGGDCTVDNNFNPTGNLPIAEHNYIPTPSSPDTVPVVGGLATLSIENFTAKVLIQTVNGGQNRLSEQSINLFWRVSPKIAVTAGCTFFQAQTTLAPDALNNQGTSSIPADVSANHWNQQQFRLGLMYGFGRKRPASNE